MMLAIKLKARGLDSCISSDYFCEVSRVREDRSHDERWKRGDGAFSIIESQTICISFFLYIIYVLLSAVAVVNWLYVLFSFIPFLYFSFSILSDRRPRCTMPFCFLQVITRVFILYNGANAPVHWTSLSTVLLAFYYFELRFFYTCFFFNHFFLN